MVDTKTFSSGYPKPADTGKDRIRQMEEQARKAIEDSERVRREREVSDDNIS